MFEVEFEVGFRVGLEVGLGVVFGVALCLLLAIGELGVLGSDIGGRIRGFGGHYLENFYLRRLGCFGGFEGHIHQ